MAISKPILGMTFFHKPKVYNFELFYSNTTI